MMKKRFLRLIAGLIGGIAVLAVGVWGLSKSLATPETSYRGKPCEYWVTQLSGPDASASNAAATVLNNEIIPYLTNVMFHDTHDPAWKLRLVEALDGLPGIEVDFQPADVRRKAATYELGEYGPAARKAVPSLLQALLSDDDAVRETAARSLGTIDADPEDVIPVLVGCLIDDNVNARAAGALGVYGQLAKPAVPELVRMWQRSDSKSRLAAGEALKLIDAGAYAQMIQNYLSRTNSTGSLGNIRAGDPAGR